MQKQAVEESADGDGEEKSRYRGVYKCGKRWKVMIVDILSTLDKLTCMRMKHIQYRHFVPYYHICYRPNCKAEVCSFT
jgi:hypothetical protein